MDMKISLLVKDMKISLLPISMALFQDAFYKDTTKFEEEMHDIINHLRKLARFLRDDCNIEGYCTISTIAGGYAIRQLQSCAAQARRRACSADRLLLVDQKSVARNRLIICTITCGQW